MTENQASGYQYQPQTFYYGTPIEVRQHLPSELDYKYHALHAAITYHRDIVKWGKIGATEDDRKKFDVISERDILKTALVFDKFLHGNFDPKEKTNEAQD